MKKIILFLSAFLFSVSVFSQAGMQTFGLSAGAMFPMGDLADNNLADSSSGVALRDITFRLLTTTSLLSVCSIINDTFRGGFYNSNLL